MIKVMFDDYQDVFKQIINLSKYKDKFIFKVFNEPFADEIEAIVALEEYEVLFIKRERTTISKSLIKNLPKIKYITFA